MTAAFTANISHFIAARGLDLVRLAPGHRKDEVTAGFLQLAEVDNGGLVPARPPGPRAALLWSLWFVPGLFPAEVPQVPVRSHVPHNWFMLRRHEFRNCLCRGQPKCAGRRLALRSRG
jgi:hypothetical protein